MENTENITENTENTEDTKKVDAFKIVCMIVIAIIVFLLLAEFIVGINRLIYVFFVPLVILVSTFLGYLSSKKGILKGIFIFFSIVSGILIWLSSCFPPSVLSHSVGKYKLQKMYINMYRNIKSPDWLPDDFSDDVVSDYTFSYSPTVLQGTGHYSVEFVTTLEKAKEYEEIYSKKAKYIFSRNNELNHYEEKNKNNLPDYSIFSGFFWNEDSEPTVYLLYTNDNWNHPNTSAVLIEGTKVQFSQMG